MTPEHRVLLLMIIFAIMFLGLQKFKRNIRCRYCGGDWGKHDDTCPMNHNGAGLR